MNGLLELIEKLFYFLMIEEEKIDKLNEFLCVYLLIDVNRLEKLIGLIICDILDFEDWLVNVNDI